MAEPRSICNTSEQVEVHAAETMQKLQEASDKHGVPAASRWDRNSIAELEWVNSEYDCSFKIEDGKGYWHAYSFADDTSEEKMVDLGSDIVRTVRRLLFEKFGIADQRVM